MKSRLQLLREESSKTHLAPEERASLRESLIAYIDTNPIQGANSRNDEPPLPHSNYSRIGIAAIIVVLGLGIMYSFPEKSKEIVTSFGNHMMATILPGFSVVGTQVNTSQ